MLLLGCFLDKCWMCTATAMTGHSALPRYAFSVSMRRLRRLLCYAIFLLRDLRARWLVLAARCSIAKVVLYFRRSIAAARVSESSLQTRLVNWTCRRPFSSACLYAATLYFYELSSAVKTGNFRLFRGACAIHLRSPSSSSIGRRALCTHVPTSSSLHGAIWAVQSKTGGDLGAAQLSHPRRRGGRLLPSS